MIFFDFFPCTCYTKHIIKQKGRYAMNLAALMQFKGEWDGFKLRHPKFPLFLKAARRQALQEGSIIEIKITALDGTVLNSSLKIKAEDQELFYKMQEAFQ